MEAFSVERESAGFYTVSSGDPTCPDSQGEALYLMTLLLLGKGDAMTLLKTKEEHAWWARLNRTTEEVVDYENKEG
jgi:hypothetical protein